MPELVPHAVSSAAVANDATITRALVVLMFIVVDVPSCRVVS